MGSVPAGLLANFSVTLNAAILLEGGQLYLMPQWAVRQISLLGVFIA